jgi:hypothetical protein
MQEARKKLLEVHEKTCEDGETISLYCRLKWLGYFWLNMSAETEDLQSQCPTCQLHYNNEEVCATFISTDWLTSFLKYLLEGILQSNAKDVYHLKRLALRYFVKGGILFRKGFHGEPLRCLSLSDSQMVMRETHARECGEHQGKKRLYQHLLTLGYYWPTMKKDTLDFVKTCHTCQVQANLVHTHPTSLQNMATPWPHQSVLQWTYFDSYGYQILHEMGGSHPTSKNNRCCCGELHPRAYNHLFWHTYKLISDNGTPFINKDVQEVLEHYQIKRRHSTPYYPQGNGQVEATNQMLLRILSKMVFDYGND